MTTTADEFDGLSLRGRIWVLEEVGETHHLEELYEELDLELELEDYARRRPPCPCCGTVLPFNPVCAAGFQLCSDECADEALEVAHV